MSLKTILLLSVSPLLLAQPEDRAKKLDLVAQVATAIVDGDVCLRIQTPRSVQFLLKTDPRDPWIASDNYDVDHDAFIQTKKTLMRVSQLCPDACDANLWMPVPGNPTRIQVMIRNVYEMSSFWKWGDLHQEMPQEMKREPEKLPAYGIDVIEYLLAFLFIHGGVNYYVKRIPAEHLVYDFNHSIGVCKAGQLSIQDNDIS